MVSDFRALRKEVEEEGLMNPDPWYYVQKGVVLSGVFVGIVAAVVGSGSTLVRMLAGILLGCFWNQVNFIGHDAGHNSITGIREIDSKIGYFVGNFCTGISIGWWKRSHNVHHVVCNSITHDPDLQHVPVFAVSDGFFKNQYSFYHFRKITFDAVAQFLISYQHLTFYPIMAVARINLYIQSLLLMCSTTQMDNRPLEFAAMFGFWMWNAALLYQLPSFWEKVAFFMLSQASSGMLHVQICISHFSSPTYEGRKSAALWVLTQLVGTMDVDCPEYMDWFHGGLQFQTEHHIFPRMPRRNLRAISPRVQDFCAKHNIPYISKTFFNANGETVRTLRKRALQAQQYRKDSKSTSMEGESPTESFLQSLLWDALNARG